MNVELKLQNAVIQAVKALYGQDVREKQVTIQKTNKDFEGHLTVVVFPFLKASGKAPQQTAEEIGNWMIEHTEFVDKFNVVKGFLNLSIATSVWLNILEGVDKDVSFGKKEVKSDAPFVMIEYASPNTNKPLHLGHIRNILLGYTISNILDANGLRVFKTNIVNDRGIHICKSMLAWEKWGNGETPASSGMKGDHLVGKYYVEFDKHYKAEVKELMEKEGCSKEIAEANAPSMIEAREMLLKWESGDEHIINLWKTMNGWVYDGFDVTYKKLGVDFDKIYYESSTYIDGREVVIKGLKDNILYQKDDKSIWIDLTNDGLDNKLLLRGDGTSVYMTQDIGTAKQRFNDFTIDKMVYVVGNEQNYHFQVLSLVLDKLGFSFGKDLVHFSYGMIELPEGKMKSREGTVVDADDLMAEMIDTAKKTSEELGKLDGCSTEQIDEITEMVGLGALKYFILKVDPKKNMIFNPKESIDFNGNTAPFIQYTHARIKSILRNAEVQGIATDVTLDHATALAEKELNLIQLLSNYPNVVEQAGLEYSPALIANYIYDLVKEYNQFYHDYPILKEANENKKNIRLCISKNVAKVIKSGMNLLSIQVPERM